MRSTKQSSEWISGNTAVILNKLSNTSLKIPKNEPVLVTWNQPLRSKKYFFVPLNLEAEKYFCLNLRGGAGEDEETM